MILVGPGEALPQAYRLLDPEADSETYRLVESIANRVPPTRSLVFTAKPWSTEDVLLWIGEVDSLLVEQPDPFASRLLGYLKEIQTFGLEEETGPEGSAWVVGSARVYGAAGDHDLEPAFRSVRAREGLGTPSAVLEGGLRVGAEWPAWNLAGAVDFRGLTNARDRFDLRVEDDEAEVAARTAYLAWQDGPWLLAVGRVPIEWGNGVARGLGISAAGPAQDGFVGRARFGPAQFTIFSAFLQDEPQNRRLDERGNTIASSLPDPSEPVHLVDRYLFGHRVDVRVFDQLTVGVEEMALVTGVRRHLPLAFANGLIPYFALQESSEETDGVDINLGVGLQYRWRPIDPLTIYGSFFANEVFTDTDVEQVFRGLLGRRANTQGFQQGARFSDPVGLKGVTMRFEWVRLEHFLYLHRGLNTNWEQAGVPLGSPLGPDVMEWSGGVEIVRTVGSAVLLADLGLIRRRRGVGRIGDFEDVQRTGGNRTTPRGPEEAWWVGEGTVRAVWPHVGEAGFKIVGGRIDDPHNVPGERIDPVSLEFTITIREGWMHAF